MHARLPAYQVERGVARPALLWLAFGRARSWWREPSHRCTDKLVARAARLFPAGQVISTPDCSTRGRAIRRCAEPLTHNLTAVEGLVVEVAQPKRLAPLPLEDVAADDRHLGDAPVRLSASEEASNRCLPNRHSRLLPALQMRWGRRWLAIL